jgi:hypothetical protein
MRINAAFAPIALGTAVFVASAAAQSHLEIKVHTGHGQTGYDGS